MGSTKLKVVGEMNGILDPVQHAKIIANMEQVTLTGGIHGKYLYSSMVDYCGQAEIDWVKKFHKYRAEGVSGLVLEGVGHPDSRMQAIAAALIRNYIDARVIPLNVLLDLQDSGELPSATVILIPNLFVSVISKGIPAWRVQLVFDILLQRSFKNLPTVVYVEDLKLFDKVFGSPFAQFLGKYKLAHID